MKRCRGGVLLETALLLPFMIALLVGTVDLGKLAYTYYMLQKTVYTMARFLGTRQGVNFCDAADPNIQAAIDYALTGSTDSADNPIIPGLTAANFAIRIERYDPASGQLTLCDCSATGCDASQGGLPPDFIVVSLVNYTVQPAFWGFVAPQFSLQPSVRVPYGGT